MTLELDNRVLHHVEPAATGRDRDPNPRTMALLAGWSYVALFVLAVFANFFVRERLVVTTDATATFTNLAADQGLVRLAILAFVAVFVLDVAVAWALYHLFRPAGRALSTLAAWFRIVYTVFLGVAVVFLYTVLRLVGDDAAIAALGRPTLEANTMLALDAFNITWMVGLVAFGLHLILLAVMILRTGIANRVLGVVLAVAGAAYVFDTTAFSLYPDYEAHTGLFTAIVAIPAVFAEAAFTLWLLRKAGRAC